MENYFSCGNFPVQNIKVLFLLKKEKKKSQAIDNVTKDWKLPGFVCWVQTLLERLHRPPSSEMRNFYHLFLRQRLSLRRALYDSYQFRRDLQVCFFFPPRLSPDSQFGICRWRSNKIRSYFKIIPWFDIWNNAPDKNAWEMNLVCKWYKGLTVSRMKSKSISECL